jgi:ketosteroid isomerase-like protein
MGLDDNKAVIGRYFDAIRAGSPDLPELLCDDVTWWVPEASSLGGLHEGKAAVLGLIQRGALLYDTSVPMQVVVDRLVAEGDRVCAEVSITARTAGGDDYRNQYHFAFGIRDGRIAEVREYVDTLYAERKLFAC